MGENAYSMHVAVYARKMSLSLPKRHDIQWWLGGGCSEIKHHIQPSGLEGSEWNSRVGRFDLEVKPTV